MWAEELNLVSLDDQNSSQEVSEKDKQNVSEDSKKAQKVQKQIKKSQIKWKEMALFLAKILWRYYDNWSIINIVHSFLENIDKEYNNLVIIFSPFLEDKREINKINDYINYVKNNIKKIDDNHIDLIVSLIEVEKLSWEQLKGEQLWNSLKKDNSGISYEKFINELKWELKN